MSEEIRWITLKNNGGFVVKIRVKGGSSSYNGSNFPVGQERSVDIADAVGKVKDGDTVYLEAVVKAGKNKTAKERFIYRKKSNKEACYAIKGTTLSNSLSYKGLNNKYDLIAQPIRWISLKNNGAFTVSIRVKGGSSSYNSSTFPVAQERAIDLAEAVGKINDGDEVWLEAVVTAGTNNTARQHFIYRKNSNTVAKYSISGTTLNNSLTYKGFEDMFTKIPQPIRWLSLQNDSAAVVSIRIKGGSKSYNNSSFATCQKKIVDLADAGDIIKDGDIVWLETVVTAGYNNTGRQCFVYQKDSNTIAKYSFSGTTLNNTLHYNGINDMFVQEPIPIRWISLKNSAGFVVGMRIKGGSSSYNTDTFPIAQERTVDLAHVDGKVKDGDKIWLEAVVVGGENAISKQCFIYHKDADCIAKYTISGTTLDNSLSYDGWSIYAERRNLPIRYISLINSSATISHIRIQGGSQSYNIDTNILSGEKKTADLANSNGKIKEGDDVWLEAVVVGGNNNMAIDHFKYSQYTQNTAIYTLTGNTIENKLIFSRFLSYDDSYKDLRTYDKVNANPCNQGTNYTNDIQGICHDENAWYISQGAGKKKFDRNYGSVYKIPKGQSLGKNIEKHERNEGTCDVFDLSKGENHLAHHRFYKIYNNSNKVIGFKIGEIHFGDIDCHKGFLFIPVYQNGDDGSVDAQILIFKTDTFECIHREILYKKDKIPFNSLGWCAINPNDDCLYTSDSHISSYRFDGKNSPIMAFKIDFDRLNKGGLKIDDHIFTLVTPNGIQLEMPNHSEFIIIDSMQGGCFDPYDTLYLSSGYEEHEANDGIFAFKLKRDIEQVRKEYIEKRAYFIWEEHGCRPQNKEQAQQDWKDAEWQIDNAFKLGNLAFSKAPHLATVFLKKNENTLLTSPIAFDFEGAYDNTKPLSTAISVYAPQEPEGLTYWDLRDCKKATDYGYSKASLHALLLTNNGSAPVYDSFSMRNYNITSVEASDYIVNYNPYSLEVKYNPLTNSKVIISDGKTPIWNFSDDQDANTLISIFSQFRQLLIIGNKPSNCNPHDFSKAILQKPVSKTNLYQSASEVFCYSQAYASGFNLGSTPCSNPNTQRIDNNDILFFWAATLVNSANNQDKLQLSVYNEDDAKRIVDMSKQFSKLCILNSSTEKNKLYWFE